MPWSRAFEDPIPLPGDRRIVTLEGAANYIQKLSKAERDMAHWQTAVRILIDAAEGRDFIMHARIGMLRALNYDKPKPAPRGKHARTYRIIR